MLRKIFLTICLLGISFSFAFAKDRKALEEDTKKRVIKVLEANEKLHQSFMDYSGDEVEKNAKKVLSAIKEIEDKEIAKLLKFSQKKLKAISSDNERKANNQNYHLFSMALIHVVNTYDVGEKYNAYSCPMVKKKWVQNTSKKEKVHNPYAPGMPHCGSQDTNY